MAHLWGWCHVFRNSNVDKMRPCGHNCLQLPIQMMHSGSNFPPPFLCIYSFICPVNQEPCIPQSIQYQEHSSKWEGFRASGLTNAGFEWAMVLSKHSDLNAVCHCCKSQRGLQDLIKSFLDGLVAGDIYRVDNEITHEDQLRAGRGRTYGAGRWSDLKMLSKGQLDLPKKWKSLYERRSRVWYVSS